MKPLLRTLPAAVLLALAPAAAAQTILPRPGATLTRVHAQFRWEPIPQAVGDYELRVVEDDGSGNPFASGSVQFHSAPAAEPRVNVTRGLEFGKAYAWRAVAWVGPPPLTRVAGPVHRFAIEPLPSFVPPLQLRVPPGAAPVEPGYVTFGHFGLPASGFTDGLVLTVDAQGEIVHFYHRRVARPITDVRMLTERNRRGRLSWISDGRGFETTIDGDTVWSTPAHFTVHHEMSPLPGGDHLAMVTDERFLDDPLGGQQQLWLGDAILRLDRHTREVVWSWSTFDGCSTLDVHPAHGTEDWTHGNAAVLDPATGRVWASFRSLDRVSCIDFATGDLLFHMGREDYPAGDVAFGHNLFSHQHAPQPLPGGNLVLYDNGNELEPLGTPRQTRAIELAFDDPDAPTDASIVWSYEALDGQGQPIFTPFVGDADRLPGGHTLVNLGSVATIDEVDAGGDLLWRLEVGTGVPFNLIYRAEKIPHLLHDTPGDSDGDWDLDMADFARLQAAVPRPGGAVFPDTLVDLDEDGRVDKLDARLFGRWQTGPARPGL